MITNLKKTLAASALVLTSAAATLPMQASAQQVTGDTYAAARTGRSVIARATAYSSHAAQTDSTPNITATGTRTRPGVVALSPDLRRIFPYGTRVWLTDPATGRRMGPYVVEDSTSARKTRTVDIWMYSRSEALRWGVRNMVISRA